MVLTSERSFDILTLSPLNEQQEPRMSHDRQYLEKLQDYYARYRVLPSYAAMGELLGLRSKSSVAALVERLKEAGFVEATPGRRLAPTAQFFGRAIANSPVRAGMPQAAEAGSSETISLDGYLVEKPSRTVLIRVRGDSMNDAGILDGDLAVVECTPSAKRGDIVVAIVDDEFTLKRLDTERGRFVLKPENKAYPTIRPQGALEIFGVMVGLVRKTAH